MEDRFALLAQVLPGWFDRCHRDLPWRRDREPYHVWLSEVMLQQTRVEAVRGYYIRFLEAFPTIAALAAAEPDALHKLWEGLGYYSRVRNLQKAAQTIMAEHGGVFPREYEAIRALPGVGDYTAGAVASICFELPAPAVDGNVLRVVSRVEASFAPITSPRVKKEMARRLAAVYPAGRCGAFTQSLMELGATVCLPNGTPRCGECPCRDFCAGYRGGVAEQLPVREPKKARRLEKKTVFLLRCGARYGLVKRPGKGLLAGLWSFPNVEGFLTPQQAVDQAARWGAAPEGAERCVEREHVFTHVRWELRCYHLPCRVPCPPFVWVTGEELERDYALPTAFRQFWEGSGSTGPSSAGGFPEPGSGASSSGSPSPSSDGTSPSKVSM